MVRACSSAEGEAETEAEEGNEENEEDEEDGEDVLK
tara:strand:- start:734 stop:841 length:108 start_codon:yes stop_codon:yes gene_type:complete